MTSVLVLGAPVYYGTCDKPVFEFVAANNGKMWTPAGATC